MCKHSSVKTTKILHFCKRQLHYFDHQSFRVLYPSLIRPHLEYCSQTWIPFLRQDIDLMERVQRRATKMVLSLYNLPYEERHSRLNLFPLEYRRIRGLIIHTFRLYLQNQLSLFFIPASNTNLREHPAKLFKPRCNTRSRLFSYSYFTISIWNKLPPNIFDFTNLSTFKNHLDIILPSIIRSVQPYSLRFMPAMPAYTSLP